ncbi:rhomboid family intramembrane serine protease [Granulicella sp. dw_53]|uniref:rhomboid family intramembrane serine protease n=1 Tax=Granulicella sp. dw_53 TaxID=2719792 RepID=UPI001BD2464A|nr:rhomboid family intramembrane serine protease [Granulicella sp. dw_53]
MSPSSYPQGEVLPPREGTDAYGAQGNVGPVERTQSRGRNLLSAPATYILVGINVAVFVWMVLHGVSPKEPTTNQLLQYGATNPDYILGGQWWRLLTAIFVHVGLIHIATNMWCLWNLGLLGEPLLGPFGLAAVYVLTGVAGNLLSLAINVIFREHESVGAGASGAVFGIAGILIVLLSNHKLPIPWTELKRLRRSVMQFAGLNLVIGLATVFTNIIRIDNFAHLGGFLSGLAMGVPLVPRMTSGRVRYLRRQKFTFAVSTFLLALFGYWISNLK